MAEAGRSWKWTLDGAPISPTREDIDSGVRFSFETTALDDGPHSLTLSEDSDELPLFTLQVVPDPVVLDNFAFGTEVKAALASRSPADRTELADALLAGPSISEMEEVARVHYARLLAYDKRDPGGSADAVLRLLEREEKLAAELGLWSVHCGAALLGVYWGTFRQDSELTRRWKPLEASCRGRSSGLDAKFDHYVGKQALREADYADAEVRLSNARTVASRVLPEQSVEASKNMMELYVRTGRWSEAEREVRSLQALVLGHCERANLESWLGFVRIRARQNGTPRFGATRPGLELARRAHRPGGACENAYLLAHDLAKLGYDAALRGDASALRDSVEQLSKMRLDGKYASQAAELELELAVLERRFSEVPSLSLAMERLAMDGEPEARWRRHMILARAALAKDDNAAAQLAYLAAEDVLDQLWDGVNSDALRARWLSAYRRSALGLMRARLDDDDLEGAACAARSARLRALDLQHVSGVERGPCERPWARSDGEAVFLIVPETKDDWYVFEIVEEQVVGVTHARAPGTGENTDWWDAWTDAIGSAGRVRILASDAALHAPLHALTWRGEPLIQQRPVTFGLDLDPLRAQRRVVSAPASVVFADADPYRSLQRYAADIRRVYSTLEQGGWGPRWLETSTRIPKMKDAIDPGGLLVYFGHGERVSAEGSAMLEHAGDVGSTALLVANNTYWGIEDVSGLDAVPWSAVLLGCDVAFPDGRSWTGGLSLAHALLLAGTSEVLAATGPLEAAMAAEVGVPLFTDQTPQRLELSVALHEVWSKASGPGTRAPLAALRVWSR